MNFSYRDNLWRGSDLLATGVASFGHVSGVHYQNLPEWAGYVGALERGELPLSRGMRPTPHQLLVREMILQLKTGRLDAGYFRRQIRRRNSRRLARRLAAVSTKRLLEIEGATGSGHAGRSVASRRPAAGIFRAGAPRRDAIHERPNRPWRSVPLAK